MSITFAVDNALEATDVTVTVCNAASTGPARRLHDRVRTLQYAASSSGTAVVIDATGTVHHPVGSLVLVNHTVTSTGILFGSTGGAYTSVATFNPFNVDPYYTTFAAFSTEYLAWRVRFCADVSKVKIGELLIGCAQVIGLNPRVGLTEGVRANRVDAESVAGHVWSVRLGSPRTTYALLWDTLSCGDWGSLSSAYEVADDGAKAFLLLDYSSCKLWARFTQPALEGRRVTTALREVRTEVMEAL